jgi:hypothetical protein
MSEKSPPKLRVSIKQTAVLKIFISTIIFHLFLCMPLNPSWHVSVTITNVISVLSQQVTRWKNSELTLLISIKTYISSAELDCGI